MSGAAAKAGPASFGQRAGRLVLLVWYLLAVVFLFAPIVTSIVYAFNVGLIGKQSSIFTSLEVSFWAALISLLLGSALGYALIRHPNPAIRRALTGLTYILLIVPETVTGVSLLLFYAVTRVPLSFWTLVAGITPLAISVVALIVRAGVLTLDRRLDEAAADLGANPAQTLWFVVLPHLMPAMLAGALMAYVFSFDNLVVSSFLTTPQVNTLPVYLYGSLQYGPSPAIYAAAAAVFVFTMLILAIAALLYRLVLRTSARAPH
jgi:ABC-type spermidine/putrescine transport system permease subunit II